MKVMLSIQLTLALTFITGGFAHAEFSSNRYTLNRSELLAISECESLVSEMKIKHCFLSVQFNSEKKFEEFSFQYTNYTRGYQHIYATFKALEAKNIQANIVCSNEEFNINAPGLLDGEEETLKQCNFLRSKVDLELKHKLDGGNNYHEVDETYVRKTQY